jgi:hypothetical protein
LGGSDRTSGTKRKQAKNMQKRKQTMKQYVEYWRKKTKNNEQNFARFAHLFNFLQKNIFFFPHLVHVQQLFPLFSSLFFAHCYLSLSYFIISLTDCAGKKEMTELDLSKGILNVNVGVLGHVDSGKTSLGIHSIHTTNLSIRVIFVMKSTHQFTIFWDL